MPLSSRKAVQSLRPSKSLTQRQVQTLGRRFKGTNASTPHAVPDHVIFSGIQPTGIPHLGNYLGALQQWVKLQNASPPSTKLLFSVVDLHALTVPQDYEKLKQWKRELLATLLAIGLNPDRSILFYQSEVALLQLCYQFQDD